jgi:hypothetical protein
VWDEDLDNLDEWIRRLRVEYEIFFNGHRKKPPEDLKTRVEKQVKKLAEVNMNFTERFRYNTLVGRFYVYRDHWRRLMQEREQGLDIKSAARTATGTLDAQAEQVEDGDGIEIVITDPEAEESKVKQLYEWLSSVRGKHAGTAPEVPYQQFAKYISTQTQGIKEKLGCTSVVFRVCLQEDAIKFTARGNSA